MILSSGRLLDLSEPVIMGIVNATPDSFFPESRFSDTAAAVDAAMGMLGSGAAIVDIGGESSRPGAEKISVEEEIARVVPVIEKIREKKPRAVISIDTCSSVTARAALAAGADIVNDITGLRSEEMIEVASQSNAAVIIMHMRGDPSTMSQMTDYGDVVEEVSAWLVERAKKAVESGIRKDRIILDPGIGFAKTAEQSIEILRNVDRFLRLGFPLLVGHSRKSFIAKLTGNPVENRLVETLSISTYLYLKGVNIIRVHDVREHDRIFGILKILNPYGENGRE
ncbi:MAG TPA: dihydropteroate synthase [Mesotoga infera]|uniref:dihydropteroate synthase n=1 Tax=Mesotoga infera TaxID=1236046 RepID=A0A7C1CY34_9BACT|nr:dihydropteroate synthase [Mesotoga infera]